MNGVSLTISVALWATVFFLLKDWRYRSAWLLLPVYITHVGIHFMPTVFPEIKKAFYILRGVEGAIFFALLATGFRLAWPIALIAGFLELSTSVGALLFGNVQGAEKSGIIDAALGLPIQILVSAFAFLCVLLTLRMKEK